MALVSISLGTKYTFLRAQVFKELFANDDNIMGAASDSSDGGLFGEDDLHLRAASAVSKLQHCVNVISALTWLALSVPSARCATVR